MKPSHLRKAGQRGSQAVELALTMVPILAIMFLLIDLCLAIFLKATFQQAVREGVRYAVTGRTETDLGQDASIRSVVQHFALGFIRPVDADETIKIRYFRPDTLVEKTGVGSNAGGNIVEVAMEGFSWRPIAALMKSGLPVGIGARSSDLVEPCSATGCPTR